MKKYAPNIPDSAFEADELHRRLSGALGTLGVSGEAIAEGLPADIWNCVVRKLGFWGAIAFYAIIIIADSLWLTLKQNGIDPTVAFWTIVTIMLAAAILVGEVATLAFIIMCAINPRS